MAFTASIVATVSVKLEARSRSGVYTLDEVIHSQSLKIKGGTLGLIGGYICYNRGVQCPLKRA